MRVLRLTIAYDGTRYAGWQAQARGGRRGAQRRGPPTIQGTLERTLRRILREPAKIVGSGRTDAGVHAYAQVAHLVTRSSIAATRLLRSLNQLLPPDLAVTEMAEARRGFHARFDASSKRYRYRIFTGEVVPPFIRRYVFHCRHPLHLARMRREVAALNGRHDVRAFARASGRAAGTTIRTVSMARISRHGEELIFDIEGSGFLHTMVRSIVGTLVDVGRGRLPAGTIRRMLATGNRRLAGTTAPAHGLALMEVRYATADRAQQGQSRRLGLAARIERRPRETTHHLDSRRDRGQNKDKRTNRGVVSHFENPAP